MLREGLSLMADSVSRKRGVDGEGGATIRRRGNRPGRSERARKFQPHPD